MFIPAESKGVSVLKDISVFPDMPKDVDGKPFIYLSSDKGDKKNVKYITFSKKAIELLLLQDKDRLGLVRGNLENKEGEEPTEVYALYNNKQISKTKYVNKKGNEVNLACPAFRESSKKIQSTVFFDILMNHYFEEGVDKAYLLLKDYEGFFVIENITKEEPEDVEGLDIEYKS